MAENDSRLKQWIFKWPAVITIGFMLAYQRGFSDKTHDLKK